MFFFLKNKKINPECYFESYTTVNGSWCITALVSHIECMLSLA